VQEILAYLEFLAQRISVSVMQTLVAGGGIEVAIYAAAFAERYVYV